MLEKDMPAVGVFDSIGHMKSLILMARKCAEKHDLESMLLASFIYSSLAEYCALVTLQLVEVDLNFYLARKLRSLGLMTKKHKRTNLEYLIGELSRYRFHKSKEMIDHLKELQGARNSLFHNLMLAPEKGISIERESRKISSLAEKILKLHFESARPPYKEVIWGDEE